jgi:hypothetical protein
MAIVIDRAEERRVVLHGEWSVRTVWG